MSVFDADDLVRLAGRIDDQAGALRGMARSLSGAAHRTRWHSPAATTWRAQVAKLDREIQHSAHNLERAAHELRAHAARVRTVQVALAAVARAERVAVHDVGQVAGGAAHAVEHAGGWLGGHL